MKAVVLYKTGKPDVLTVSEIPLPETKPGWVLIKVKAFGLNRSELAMRAYEGDAPYINLPRILGIECAGEIADPSDSGLPQGQRVIALMGGMGRSFNGSYAEYALVPVRNVFTVDTNISWEELAAIPETYFTAYGSLFNCLQIKNTDTLFIRGGTSAAGLASIQMAKSIGAAVLASTRNESKSTFLKEQGADHVVIDNENLTEQLFNIYPEGVTKVLELIGPYTLLESIKFVRYHGIICSTGQLGGKGILNNFDPIKDLPNGVYLSSFSSNYPTQKIIDTIFEHMKMHHLHPIIGKVFSLNEIGQAHLIMENNDVNGKVVIKID
jgi:NADPH2:quinone reductase